MAHFLPQLWDSVIPSIKEREEEQQRWARAREKTAKQLGSNWGGLSGGGEVFGRQVTALKLEHVELLFNLGCNVRGASLTLGHALMHTVLLFFYTSVLQEYEEQEAGQLLI